MYVGFLESHVMYTSSFFQMLCIGQLESKERDFALEQRGNTNERRWRRARGGNARAHRPSSSSWCRHTCQCTDRRRPANLLPFLSVTELNLSELQWGIAVWRRSHCYWWVNLQRTSYHICVWRASHPPFEAAVCFGWEHSVYLIEAATAGLRFTEQWYVECAFSKGCVCFVILSTYWAVCLVGMWSRLLISWPCSVLDCIFFN